MTSCPINLRSEMHYQKILAGLILLAGLLAADAQIPSRAERERDSGFNQEYWSAWRSGYLQLPAIADPEEGQPDLKASFRLDLELPAAARRAELTLYVPGRDRVHPYWFTVNDVEVEGPRWGKLQLGGLRNLDITQHLRPGRNVLTFSSTTRRGGGQAPSAENWLVVEGIVFCDDGSTHRILTEGWRGGWNPGAGWNDASRKDADIADMETIKAGAPLRWSVNPYTCFPPYYGPIAVHPAVSGNGQSEQPIFDEGKPVILAVALLNMQRVAKTAGLTVEVMDEMSRNDMGTRRIECSPDGKNDLAGTLDLGRLNRGTYRLRFVLKVDGEEVERRDVEIAVVGVIPQRLVEGSDYKDGLDLDKVWEIDCAEEPAEGMFIAAHTDWKKTPDGGVKTRVLKGAAGQYRELESPAGMLYFAFQYRLKNVYTPHLAVVEWPDDAVRNFIAHVTEEASGAGEIFGHQRSDASVNMANDLQPERSGQMRKLHLLFWPNAERGAVHIANIGGGKRGAAVARITIYEITNDLPALRIADAGERLLGPHTERGPQTMSAAYYAGPMGNAFTFRMAANDHPEFYRNWYTTAENFIKRMRFEGQNLYTMGHLMYNGTLYPSRMSEWGYRQDNYFGGDAVRDYVTLLLRMFGNNGMYMISNIEHMNVPAFTKRWAVDYTPAPEEIIAGAEHTLLIRRDGTVTSSPNYFHPYIQDGLIAMVGELADLYGAYPAWKGVQFILSTAHGGFGPIDILSRDTGSLEELPEYGYEDYTVNRFAEQTGISVPGEPGDPDRYRKRYEWIMTNARDQWVQWRCDQYTQLWRRMGDRLRRDNPDLELYLMIGEPLMFVWRPTQHLMEGHYDDPDYSLRLMRMLGIDLPALQAEKGIRILKSYAVAGSGAASSGHEGWRELNRNREFQALFADDGRGGVYMATSIIHFGNYSYPWSKNESERIWLWDRVLTRQGWFWSTHVVESFVNVMARSNPTLMPHTWMDVNESMGRIQEKRLFARAYRSLPNGQYSRLTGNGLDRNLWVSRTVRDGMEYAYAANLHWWDLEVSLQFEAGARVHDLIADRPVVLQDNAWRFTLGPYQIQTFRVEDGKLSSGASVIEDGARALMESQLTGALEQTAQAVADARARAPELSRLPAWGTVGNLDQRLKKARAYHSDGDAAAAYTALMGGESPMLREALVGDLLQAMPMLVLGPFGREADTAALTPTGKRIGNPEVVPGFCGMETPFIDEFDDEAGARLTNGFRAAPTAKYTGYNGRETTWKQALHARALVFSPHAHAPHPYWMVGYAYTEVYSPDARDAVLRVGSDHAVWVWLNDQRVIKHGGFGVHRGGQRPGSLGQDTATIALAAGWNRFLVKAVQRDEARLMLQFTDAAGRPMTDLRYRVPELETHG